MATTRAARLGVGVVGLGRLWEARHRPALARLKDRFRVVALYDQVGLRAAMEARNLGCAASEGLSDLVGRSDVQALLLLTPQWFGLHAASLAARAGKAIYCAVSPASDPAGIEALAPELRASGVPFVPELPRRFYPATRRLRELLATTLGPPRLILGHARLYGFDRYGQPGPSTQLEPASLLTDPGGNLLDWCRLVFDAEPTAIGHVGAPGGTTGPEFEGFGLEFPGGGLAQIGMGRYGRGAWGEAAKFLPAPGFQVFAERGAAFVEMPDRIVWSEAEGPEREERLPLDPTVGELLEDHFLRHLRGEPSESAGLDDALALARLVKALRRSRAEGRRIELESA